MHHIRNNYALKPLNNDGNEYISCRLLDAKVGQLVNLEDRVYQTYSGKYLQGDLIF